MRGGSNSLLYAYLGRLPTCNLDNLHVDYLFNLGVNNWTLI